MNTIAYNKLDALDTKIIQLLKYKRVEHKESSNSPKVVCCVKMASSASNYGINLCMLYIYRHIQLDADLDTGVYQASNLDSGRLGGIA